METFEKYLHEAVHALQRKNDACDREYSIGNWEHYDFDLSEARLVFSQGGVPRVVADVQMVGSTGRNSNTWKWGWANGHIPERATLQMEQVREFGRQHSYSPLLAEMLDDDEYLGWELTAVAAEVLGAVGAYRCPVEYGFVYFVMTAIAWADGAQRKAPNAREIDCGDHGSGFETFVCAHLADAPAQQWYSAEPSEDNRWPDAWCGSCQEVFERDGEWTDGNSAALDIQLLCHHCYERLRFGNR